MRNTILRIFIVASLLLFGSLYYYSGQVEEHYSANATKYLEQSLADISDWQLASLKPQLSSETRAAVNDQQLSKLLDVYRPLGRYMSMEKPVFSRISGALSLFGSAPRLSYSSKVLFEHGSAIMTATLTVENQRFRYYNLSFGERQTETP